LILCSKILLDVLHNLSIPVLLLRQHTEFQTFLVLKVLLVTFCILFWHLPMVPHPRSSKHINVWGQVCALFKCFWSLKSLKIMKSGWVDWKVSYHHGNFKIFFIDIGVLPVELLAYQVSMVSARNYWLRWLYLYNWCYIGSHVLHIFFKLKYLQK